jgi:uncharacterized protein
MLSLEQKLLAALAHGGKFLGAPIIIPLIIMLVSTDEYVKLQAKESLVFELVMAACMIVSGILVVVLVGIIGLVFFGIATIVLPIIAIVKVIDGKEYSYPITGKWARMI